MRCYIKNPMASSFTLLYFNLRNQKNKRQLKKTILINGTSELKHKEAFKQILYLNSKKNYP